MNILIIFFLAKEKIKKLGDILSDIITYLLIGASLYLLVWFTGIFPRYEGWQQERHKNLSEGVKKLIITFVSFFSLLFITFFTTLYANDNIKILPFLKIDHTSFFGCPGTYVDARVNFTIDTAISRLFYEEKIDRKNYSECREEETGIDLFFIFIIYFAFIIIGDILGLVLTCCYKEKPSFRPNISIIKVFSTIILYLLVMFYIPFFAIFFPLIMLVLYKFQLFMLKKQGSFSFKETGIKQRNNNGFILIHLN